MEEQIFDQTCRISELERIVEMASSDKEYELPESNGKPRKQDESPSYHQIASTNKTDFSKSIKPTRRDEKELIQ